MLSAGNMFGRLGWAAASDFIGRKRTYALFGLAVPICLLVPTLTSSIATSHGMTPLVLFYGGIVTVVSFYGGLFSVLPAYLADIFGPKHVGAIHGRALTAWSGAAIIGPSLMSYLRQESYENAIKCVGGVVVVCIVCVVCVFDHGSGGVILLGFDVVDYGEQITGAV